MRVFIEAEEEKTELFSVYENSNSIKAVSRFNNRS